MAHYSTGLGFLGMNEKAKARDEFQKAVELSRDLLGARTALSELE